MNYLVKSIAFLCIILIFNKKYNIKIIGSVKCKIMNVKYKRDIFLYCFTAVCTISFAHAATNTISGQDSTNIDASSSINTDDDGITIKTPTDVSVDIASDGSVTAAGDGVHAKAASTGQISITNSGTITSTSDGQAIDLNDMSGNGNTTTITNTATGKIVSDNADGIRPGTNATVINSGLIYADGPAASSHDGIDFQSAPTGTVINETGGLISGHRHGITTDGFVNVINEAGATIIGRNGSGVGSDGTGQVTNYGTIIGAYDGSGTGDGDGVDIDGDAVVNNWGTIKALGAAGVDKTGSPNASEGLALSENSTVNNYAGGVIESVDNAMTLGGDPGTIAVVNNMGTVLAGGTGIWDYQNLELTNSGTIKSDYLGVSSTGTAANINNSGYIYGADAGIYMFPGSSYNIYNSGYIGGGTNSLVLAGSGNLYIEKGSVIDGTVAAGGGGINSLYLEDGAKFGSSTGLDNLFVEGSSEIDGTNTFSNVQIDAGSALTVSGAGSISGTVDDSGQLYIDGTDNQIDVNAHGSTATLSGNGSINSATIADHATLSPGSATSIGTLTIANNLSMDSTSVLAIKADTSSLKNDSVQVGGTATLNGGTVDFTDIASGASIKSGQVYTILTAQKVVTGQAANLVTNIDSIYPFISPYLEYGEDSVDVAIRRNDSKFSSVTQTRNQFGVANALDNAGSAALSSVITNMDATQARRAFNALSGEIHASARTDLVQDSFYVRNAAVDRLRDAACDPGSGNGALKTATMQGHLTDGLCQSNRSAMWMEAYGGWGRNSGDGNASGMNHSVGGFVLGADTMVAGNWRVGGMVGYGHSTFNSRAVDSYGHSNNVSIGGYAGTHWGRLAFRMGAAYTWNMLSTGRTIALSSMNNGKANSQYDAGTAQAFGDLGYRMHLGQASFEPFANVAYVNLDTDRFNEHGTAAALNGHGMDTGTTFSTFGVRASSAFHAAHFILVPGAEFAYRHTFGSPVPTTHEAFANSNATMDISGVPLSTNAAVLNIGLKAYLSDRVNVGVNYIGQYGDQSVESGLRGNIKVKF